MVSLLTLFSIQTSSVLGVGYRRAVNRTLNPAGLEELRISFETLGWEVGALVAVPLLVSLGYGYFVGEWRRDNYWNLLIVTFFVTFAAYVLWFVRLTV